MNVLIVEDEALVALLLRRILEPRGWRIDGVAATGAEAIRAAQAGKPDVVLMDVRLAGDMDGIEAARAIRSRHDHIPIIFMTGYSSGDLRERVAPLRPAGFLEKPFQVCELIACLENARKAPGFEAGALA